jgi:hypothetical protein
MAFSPEPFLQPAGVENFMVCKRLNNHFNCYDMWSIQILNPLRYHFNSFMALIFPLTGYDGPLQYTMTPGNPDSVISLQSNNDSHEEGKYNVFRISSDWLSTLKNDVGIFVKSCIYGSKMSMKSYSVCRPTIFIVACDAIDL